MNSPHGTPRFTIITATFNRCELLGRCLDSLSLQTFSSWEVVIVDDGSTDETESFVRAKRSVDKRIRYVYQENAGANAARNHGSRVAKGEYILVLDSDDEVKRNWLAELDSLITESQAEIVCCGIDFVDEEKRLVKQAKPVEDRVGTHNNGVYQSGTYAVRRDIFLALGGFLESLPAHQSSEFRMRLFELCRQEGYRIASTAQCLSIGHSHGGPNIRSDAAAKLVAAKYILDRHHDKFKTRRSIASWQASAGGCAAELRRYREARSFFAQAVRSYPRFWKNYVRWALTCLPLIRRQFWRSTGGKT